MDQVPVKLGPMALLLTVISICLTTLSILTFTTSRADLSLAGKYADTVTARYQLMNQGEEFLRDARELAGQGMPVSSIPGTKQSAGGRTTYEIEEDGMKLTLSVKTEDSQLKVLEYRVTKDWAEDTSPGNLWDGF